MALDKKSIGNRIKSIRLSLGDNLREFGERIGYQLGLSKEESPSDSIVSRWEKGVSLPSPERLQVIAGLGNISVDELLYGNLTNYMFEVLEEEFNSDDSVLYEPFLEYLRIKDELFGEVENSLTFNAETGKMNTYEQHIQVIRDFATEEFKQFLSENIENIYKSHQNYLKTTLENYDKSLVISSAKRYIENQLFNQSANFEGKVRHIINTLRLQLPTSISGDYTIDDLINLHKKLSEARLTVQKDEDYLNESALQHLTIEESNEYKKYTENKPRYEENEEDIVRRAVTDYYDSILGSSLSNYLKELKKLMIDYEKDLDKYLLKK